jgi:hypothetical protein
MDFHHHYHQRTPQQYLSLNIQSLSVASPTNISPISPISPQQHYQFDSQQLFDHAPALFDPRLPTPSTSRSSSSSTSEASISVTLPRKRSFSSTPAPPSTAPPTPSAPLLEEQSLYDDDSPMDLAYDDLGPYAANGSAPGTASAGATSPVDGAASPNEDSILLPSASSIPIGVGGASGSGQSMSGGTGGSIGILGKPMTTSNFVTKLYQCVSFFCLLGHDLWNTSKQDDQRLQVGALYRVDGSGHQLRRFQCGRVQQEHTRVAFQA